MHGIRVREGPRELFAYRRRLVAPRDEKFIHIHVRDPLACREFLLHMFTHGIETVRIHDGASRACVLRRDIREVDARDDDTWIVGRERRIRAVIENVHDIEAFTPLMSHETRELDVQVDVNSGHKGHKQGV